MFRGVARDCEQDCCGKSSDAGPLLPPRRPRVDRRPRDHRNTRILHSAISGIPHVCNLRTRTEDPFVHVAFGGALVEASGQNTHAAWIGSCRPDAKANRSFGHGILRCPFLYHPPSQNKVQIGLNLALSGPVFWMGVVEKGVSQEPMI